MKNPSDLNDIGCFGGLNWTGVGALTLVPAFSAECGFSQSTGEVGRACNLPSDGVEVTTSFCGARCSPPWMDKMG
mgnify:CR=1 FL=1|jgi:hypothetical protein